MGIIFKNLNIYLLPMAEKPKAIVHEPWTGFCAEAMVCVTDGKAQCILCLNIFFPGFGTEVASCLDENGCNCNTFGLSFLHSLLAPCIIGWYMAIKWACDVRDWNRARAAYIAGGGQGV